MKSMSRSMQTKSNNTRDTANQTSVHKCAPAARREKVLLLYQFYVLWNLHLVSKFVGTIFYVVNEDSLLISSNPPFPFHYANST